MPLIMLNMLIAIMSDTYERVTSCGVESDGKELNSLILEQESLMFWARDQGIVDYLHWAVETFGEGEGKWAGRINAITSKLHATSE